MKESIINPFIRSRLANLSVLLIIGIITIGGSVNLAAADVNTNNSDIAVNAYLELVSGFSCTGDNCFTALNATLGGTILGTGTVNDPYIFENLNITDYNGMSFSQITKYVTIRNNLITTGGIGIRIENTSSTFVIENNNVTSGTTTNDGSHGIYATLINSSIIIKDNYFNNNTDWTVRIGSTYGLGPINNTYIYNNTFINNAKGIYSLYTNSSNIYNNTFINTMDHAMSLQLSLESKIYDNKIINSGYGMFVSANNYTLIENNTVDITTKDNSYGIRYDVYYDNDLSDSIGILRNNSVSNTVGMGIDADSFALIEENTVKNTGKAGIKGGSNSTIQNNLVENFNLLKTTSGLGRGIQGYANSTITGNTVMNGDYDGIYGGNNAEITNNEVRNVAGDGISTSSVGLAKITGNTVVNTTGNGISLANTVTGSIVSQNIIQDANQNGIIAAYSPGTIVDGNTITNSGGSGIHLVQSQNSVVTDNTVTNSKLFGIYLIYSPSTFSNNILTEEIIIDILGASPTLNDYLGYSFTDDTVNGLPFAYIVNGTADITTQMGQIYIVNTHDISVTNNDFTNSVIPITIAYSTGITLNGLTLTYSSRYGVLIVDGTSIVDIIDSTITNTNGTGISSMGTVNVINSKITDNSGDGLYISGQSSVIDSEVSRNGGFGVRINWISNGVVIRDNLFDSNVGYAVAVESYSNLSPSQNAMIHHNNFINNNAGGSFQALDNGSNNQWYDSVTMEGNYWDDWSGSGTYSIEGTANTEDLYPLGTMIIFPRSTSQATTSTSSTETTTTNTNPTDTVPTSSGGSPGANNDGFIPSPPLNIVVMFLMAIIVRINRRKRRKNN